MCLFANNAPNVYDVIIAKNKILRGASHENPKFTFSVTSVCKFFFFISLYSLNFVFILIDRGLGKTSIREHYIK